MNTKVESTPGPLDLVKLVLAAAILMGGIVGYYWFEEESLEFYLHVTKKGHIGHLVTVGYPHVCP